LNTSVDILTVTMLILYKLLVIFRQMIRNWLKISWYGICMLIAES